MGGLSLYVRRTYLGTESGGRYPFDVEARATNDLDLFLSSELIVDREKVETIKQALAILGYCVDPNAKNFQFLKEVDLLGQKRTVKVDLLSAPPADTDLDKVEIKKPRIKPVGTSDIHARLTEEAEGIEIGLIAVDVNQFAQDVQLQDSKIYIPSSYNYIILKLHAFNDRKNRNDEKSDYGRHHAYDIFATVTQMNEADWETAQSHFKAHREREYLQKSITIQQECFSKPTDIGVIRLRENVAYRNRRDQYEPHLEQFLGDLRDLFAWG